MATLNASIKSSLLWQEFAVYTLDYPHRTSGDPEYTAFVDHIGEDHSHPETSYSVSILSMKLNFFYFPPKFWTILSLPSKELSSHR
jgi:hypothetical protein